MVKFLVRILLNILVSAVAIWVANYFLKDMVILGSGTEYIINLLMVSIIFGLVNALVRPIIRLISLPITCLTLGLFNIVINTLMLMLTSWISSSLKIEGALFGFVTALLASLIISLVTGVLNWVLPDENKKK